jgi:hypothetical protein
MVHSSTLVVATDRERLTCSRFSLVETIRFGSLKFIADYFSRLSLSPRGGGDSGTIFVGMIRSGSPSLQAMINYSPDEFYPTSSRAGSSSLSVSRRLHTEGIAYSRHNHMTTERCSGHSNHYDGSTIDARTAIGHRLPPRAMTRFLGGSMSLSPRSASQHRA